MDVLGVSAFRGPSAACLLRDGRIVAAAREDRFTRRPGDGSFPSESIAYCLRAGKLGPADVSGVAFAGTQELPADRADLPYSDSGGGSTLKERLGRWLGGKPGVADLVAAELDKLTPLRFVEPERAHAAGAYYGSPLPDAAVVVLGDGGASLWRGRGATLDKVRDLDATPERLAEIARALPEETDADALALGGAGAADATVVAAVRRTGVFPDLWIHPAAGGGADAVGAALEVWLLSGAPGSDDAPRADRPGVAPGPGYNAHQIRTFLRSRAASPEEVSRDEQARRAAELLADGLELGWFTGRLDLAEDSTATRSALRVPGAGKPPAAGEALVVPADRAGEILDIEDGASGAYLEAGLRDSWREQLGEPAASARPHAVSLVDADTHRELRAVLDALASRNLPPVLCARPLARPGEPVACAPDHAWDAWVDLGLDALFLGPYLLQRTHAVADSP